jgi:MOSC domain-containing protein YiiM
VSGGWRAAGPPRVVAVSASPSHTFSKSPVPRIELLPGLGVAGDAHCGATVKHRSRVARDPSQPNLRQVHLIHAELLAELSAKGFSVAPGLLGENIMTGGVELLELPAGAELRFGPTAVVRLTGLRNPCSQLDGLEPGLMAALLDRAADGAIVRKAGVMGIVVAGGPVEAGSPIAITLPQGAHVPLERV